MTVVFTSNFFNHHQKPLSDALYSLLGDSYHFIETEPISEERLRMGWGGDTKPPYVKQSYTSEATFAECQRLIDNADVVVQGSAPYGLLKNRLKNNKITFKYSERVYKKGCPYYKLPRHFWINYHKYIKHKSIYILCASAFTSADYAKTFTFLNRAYKWGYFTELKKYDIDALIRGKQPASLLWVARLIEGKHPEAVVEVARRLKADGYRFELNIIGNGELEGKIRSLIEEQGLSDCVHMLGAMKPEQVRAYMEKSEIFLFSSDRNEGWGAVLNESMNSGCAVVASHAIGSVPFLLDNGKNGYIYKNGDMDDMYQKVKSLMDNPGKRREISKNAYTTIANEWNAENAASKLLVLAQALLNGEKKPFPHQDGICSRAELLRDDWIKKG
jgi:glycosyltransferase involved in cell wall biosynthesis